MRQLYDDEIVINRVEGSRTGKRRISKIIKQKQNIMFGSIRMRKLIAKLKSNHSADQYRMLKELEKILWNEVGTKREYEVRVWK